MVEHPRINNTLGGTGEALEGLIFEETYTRGDQVEDLIHHLHGFLRLSKNSIAKPAFISGSEEDVRADIASVLNSIEVKTDEVISIELPRYSQSWGALGVALEDQGLQETILGSTSPIVVLVAHDYKKLIPTDCEDYVLGAGDKEFVWRHAHDFGQAMALSTEIARFDTELHERGQRLIVLVPVTGEEGDIRLRAARQSIATAQFKLGAI